MRRLFKKGERVRSKIDGKVMEVLKYFKKNLVEVREQLLSIHDAIAKRVVGEMNPS